MEHFQDIVVALLDKPSDLVALDAVLVARDIEAHRRFVGHCCKDEISAAMLDTRANLHKPAQSFSVTSHFCSATQGCVRLATNSFLPSATEVIEPPIFCGMIEEYMR